VFVVDAEICSALLVGVFTCLGRKLVNRNLEIRPPALCTNISDNIFTEEHIIGNLCNAE
jgi:hypothetical protein